MELTYHEGHLLLLMDRALQSGRLNRESPTFTARGMARAIGGLPGVVNRPNEYDLGALLDQMGVFAVRLRQRSTQILSEVLPQWMPEAASITNLDDRHTHTLLPALAPHSNRIR